MVKLIMTWDIKPGREQDYFAYVLKEYLPHINQMGFDVTDAWVTVFGDRPQILLGAVMPSASQARRILGTDEWGQLNDQLLNYVSNLDFKLAPHKGGFQF